MRLLRLIAPLALMLVGLPLAGIALAGKPAAVYLAFPPRAEPITHAPFSWAAFVVIAAFGVLALAPFVVTVSRRPGAPAARRGGMFPWWGWPSLVWLAAVWMLAWNRFDWFAPLQPYTFTLLWLGYVVLVNALGSWRTGRCMLSARPAYFLALFPASALFWWLFEYLNRFVQNWYYVGVGRVDAWDYFWQATLPFSTVLPAVLGTRELLASFPRLVAGLEHAWTLNWLHSRPAAWLALIVSGIGLAAVGVWPNVLFPLLWLAPLLVLTSLQVIAGEASIVDGPARGDWRAIWQAALAGLVCGGFWEMWNYASLAHWEYSVPLVQRFEIFHMPILGYLGYLPFGLECLAVAKLIDTARARGGPRSPVSRAAPRRRVRP